MEPLRDYKTVELFPPPPVTRHTPAKSLLLVVGGEDFLCSFDASVSVAKVPGVEILSTLSFKDTHR